MDPRVINDGETDTSVRFELGISFFRELLGLELRIHSLTNPDDQIVFPRVIKDAETDSSVRFGLDISFHEIKVIRLSWRLLGLEL